ncbi:hypothetical protein ACSC75_004821, partial [Escherichia coli]
GQYMPPALIPARMVANSRSEQERLYVANRRGIRVDKGEGTLAVFNTRNYTRVQTLQISPHPNSLAFDTEKKYLFLTVKNDETLIRDKQPECVARLRLIKKTVE